MKTIAAALIVLVAGALAGCGPSADTKAKDKKTVSKAAAKSPEATAEVSTGDSAPGAGQPEDRKKVHRVVGVVKEIDMAEGEVTLDHEPVASLNWPAKTSKFGVRGAVAGQLKAGQQVEFEFVQKNGDYVVTVLK